MKKSKRQVGLDFQRWIKNYLVEKGWTVHNQTGTLSRITIKGKVILVPRANDIFGCIDLVAVHPDRKPLFIQATCHTGKGKKLADLNTVKWNDDHCDVELWMKSKGVVTVWDKDGQKLYKIIRKKVVRDERDSSKNTTPS